LCRRGEGVDHCGMPELPLISPGIRAQSAAVRAIAGEQAAIVSRAQLLAAGVSRGKISRALHGGNLHRIQGGVYATVAPELLTEDGHLVAALLAVGDGALLSHGTAAWRWRIIAAPPSVITLATPRRRGGMPGLEVFASARLRADDVTHNGRFPITTVARTLLDLAARYEHRALLRALAEAEFQHDVRPADVERTLRRGHPGSANLRAALAQHAPGHGEMKSRLERRFRNLLIRHGIELPQRNQEVGPWTVDCLWRERRVVVELDGRQHERPRQADSDDDRDLWLRRHGYVVRRYGKRQIEQRPDEVIADLLEALGYAAAGAPLRLL
jgi:very-short-patch-repair endonuclease